MSRKIKVTLKRSLAGRPEKHRKTVRALGLTRVGSTRVHEETEPIKGMVFQVKHLLNVEELKDGQE
jgi:large subunit ribosomal protein L30